MSWFIVGDSKHATFAEDTGMTGFGPLLSEYGPRDAKHELRQFARTLDEKPQTLHREGRLREEYDAWKRRGRCPPGEKFEPGDYALDRQEPTPSPEANTVKIVDVLDERADEHVVEETGNTVAQHKHNKRYPKSDRVVVGVYPNMSSDQEWHFPESRLERV